MSCITCVPLLPAIPIMAADMSVPILAFNRSPKPWAFRLDLHLVFISYSMRQNRRGKGQPPQQVLCPGRKKAVLWFHSVLHEHWPANCLTVLPLLTQKQCLSLQGGSHKDCTPGKGWGKGSTGAHCVPAAWWGGGDPAGPGTAWPGPVSSIRLPWSCIRPWEHSWCPGMRLNQKNYFFFPHYQIANERERCDASTRLGLCPWGSSPTGTTTLRDFGKSRVSQKSPRNTRSSLIWPCVLKT